MSGFYVCDECQGTMTSMFTDTGEELAVDGCGVFFPERESAES